jgi:hypothetical protein
MPTSRARMHQTTVRFTSELWADLEREARRGGVSAAQYVRDATLARLAYAAARRGEPGLVPDLAESEPTGLPVAASAARAGAVAAQSDASAVWAQARLARERARSVREAARAAQARTGNTQRLT